MTTQGLRWAAFVALWLVLTQQVTSKSPVERMRRLTSANFFVDVEGASLAHAQLIANRAEHYRREIATRWFGRELPEAEERAIIHVVIEDARSSGRTLQSKTGQGSLVWLNASAEQSASTLLAHEIAHVVLADRFKDRMPDWANEGIASLYDDPERQQILYHRLRSLVQERRWRDLARLMNSEVRTPETYAVAASLTQMLLELEGPAAFLDFVEDGSSSSWDSALKTYYRIDGIDALQIAWQSWALDAVAARSFPLDADSVNRGFRMSSRARRPHKSNRF